jgi:hypothetical protein
MLKTEIWVMAHLRRCFAAGLTGVVARRGASEAGAVFVKVTQPDGGTNLFGPAPGPAYSEEGDRRWSHPLGTDPVAAETADGFLARQVAFDPDLWILEIDDRSGTGLLPPATESG